MPDAEAGEVSPAGVRRLRVAYLAFLLASFVIFGASMAIDLSPGLGSERGATSGLAAAMIPAVLLMGVLIVPSRACRRLLPPDEGDASSGAATPVVVAAAAVVSERTRRPVASRAVFALQW